MLSVRWCVLLAGLLLGCGAGSELRAAQMHVSAGRWSEALSVYDTSADRDVLHAIAEGVLERDARSGDASTRAAAFAEISAAGQGGEALLERLSRDGSHSVSRALALRARMQLGVSEARSELAALAGDENPEIVDVAAAALDAHTDRAALRAALIGPRSGRRAAALSALAMSTDSALVPDLVDAARHDPEASQRIKALSLLARFGAVAVDTTYALLADPDEPVRLEALSMLVQLEGERAVPALARYLDGKPTVESIEVAAALLRAEVPTEDARARETLSRAVTGEDAAVRARAARTVEGLPRAKRTTEALTAQLAIEKQPEVRLALALALGERDASARPALAELSQAASVVGVQAAAALAAAGDAAALERLRACLGDKAAVVRAVLARTLGGELARPLEIKSLLADADPVVQRAAAGAVLKSLD